VKAALRFQVCDVSRINISEWPESDSLPVDADLCNVLRPLPHHTQHPEGIGCSRSTLILAIHPDINSTQVRPSVIGAVAVDVVNLPGRPRTSHQEECQAVRHVPAP
jgi:hypothetical protein